MEKKKSEKFDYEKKRGLFFWIGLSISLLFVISAFEWKSEYEIRPFDDIKEVLPDDELVYITEQPPPKPPKKIKKVIPKDFIPVKDDVKVPEDIIALLDPADLTDDALDSLLTDDIPDEPQVTFNSWAVQSQPQPKNGFKGFYSFISNNLKYPREAQRLNIEGRVTIGFVVNEKGEIVEAEIIKGIGAGCDEEALRIMSLLPAWTPGKQRGKPVRVRMVLPLTFKLN
ncbi:MAG: energy transducer TonB [Bacteroidota bacterium]